MIDQPHVVADAIIDFIEHHGTDVLARTYDGFAELLRAQYVRDDLRGFWPETRPMAAIVRTGRPRGPCSDEKP